MYLLNVYIFLSSNLSSRYLLQVGFPKAEIRVQEEKETLSDLNLSDLEKEIRVQEVY